MLNLCILFYPSAVWRVVWAAWVEVPGVEGRASRANVTTVQPTPTLTCSTTLCRPSRRPPSRPRIREAPLTWRPAQRLGMLLRPKASRLSMLLRPVMQQWLHMQQLLMQLLQRHRPRRPQVEIHDHFLLNKENLFFLEL